MTKENVTRMTGYKTCQIIPMVEGAGVQDGFSRLSYHSIHDISAPPITGV